MKSFRLTIIVLFLAFYALAQEPIRVALPATGRTRDAIAETVRLNAYIQDGQLRGLQAFGIRPGSLFDRIGLRQQEVIVSVNGELFPAADIYAAIQSETVIELGVQSPSGVQRIVLFELVEN